MRKLTTIGTIFLAAAMLFYVSAVAQDFNIMRKVNFLRIFTKYIEWPASQKSGDFVMGILGDPDLAVALREKLSTYTVGSQPVVVKEFTSGNQIDGCHLIYVAASKSDELTSVVSKAKKNSILVVSEKAGVIDKSNINFIIVDSKLVYELNVKNLTNFGLKFNDQLKATASNVVE